MIWLYRLISSFYSVIACGVNPALRYTSKLPGINAYLEEGYIFMALHQNTGKDGLFLVGKENE